MTFKVSESVLGLKEANIWAKYELVMVFKNGKRFCFAPSFNNVVPM